MHRSVRYAIVAVLALFAPSAALAAPPEPSWTTFVVEAGAGVGNSGSFLEQRIEGDERELDMGLGFAATAGFGLNPAKNMQVRLTYTFASSDLAFDDDTGVDVDRQDLDDLDVLLGNVIGAEGLAFLWNQDRRVVAYGIVGVNATIWALQDDEEDRLSDVVDPGDSDTLLRGGASAGLGVSVRATDALAIRGEWNNLALGNPFDGGDAYQVSGGDTFFEPEVVRLSRITVGMAWTFGA